MSDFPTRPQVFARAQGLLLGLDGVLNVFCVRSPTYLAMRARPLAERVAALRDPATQAAVLAEYDASEGTGVGAGAADPLTLRVSENFENMVRAPRGG